MITTKDNFGLFAKACRHNSGRHFLDSGGTYGRHHEKPPIAEDCNAVSVHVDCYNGRYDVSAKIETAHWLDRYFEVDQEIQEQFWAWQEDQDDNWFELGSKFTEEVLGLKQSARDNTYNHECDLSQVFVWEASCESGDSEWYYHDSHIVTIWVHTGCDVRGGYSYPLFCRLKEDFFPTPVASYMVTENRGDREPWQIEERWSEGYSSYPAGAVVKDLRRIFTNSAKGDSFIAVTNEGEVVRIQAYF